MNFAAQGAGEFITFFCGNTHADAGFVNVSGTLNSIYTSSSYYPSSDVPARTRTIRSETQDCFDIVVIDRENTLIKMARFGAGADRVFNYSTYTQVS